MSRALLVDLLGLWTSLEILHFLEGRSCTKFELPCQILNGTSPPLFWMYLYHLKLFWWNLTSQIFLCSEPLGWAFRISSVFLRIYWEYISVFGWDELANWGPDSWSSTGSMSPRKIRRLLWSIFRKCPWPNQSNCRSFQGKKSTMLL